MTSARHRGIDDGRVPNHPMPLNNLKVFRSKPLNQIVKSVSALLSEKCFFVLFCCCCFCFVVVVVFFFQMRKYIVKSVKYKEVAYNFFLNLKFQ